MADGKYWNEAMETMSNRDLFQLESDRLVKEIHYVYERSALYRAKFDEAGSFINPANFTLFVGGLSEAVSAEAMGVCVIPAPLATTGVEKLMPLVLDLHPTVLFATPSATVFLADYVRKPLNMAPKDLGFRKGFMAGEAMSEQDRGKIEREWGIIARNLHGLADVAADLASECGESEGMHFCGQGLVTAELVDPVSSNP